MRLKNPLTFEYSHANFNGEKVEASLNQNKDISGFLDLTVDGLGTKIGTAQLQFQDNGNVVIRVHLSAQNPIHVLILDDSGTLFEQ